MNIINQLKSLCNNINSSWGYIILKSLIQNINDELSIILAIELIVLNITFKPILYPIFRIILQILYDVEILSEECLLEWILQRENKSFVEKDHHSELAQQQVNINKDIQDDIITLFQQKSVQEFVAWIREGDDDNEDDDEDDDDDDDEDDDN
jgi:hypothetical protein